MGLHMQTHGVIPKHILCYVHTTIGLHMGHNRAVYTNHGAVNTNHVFPYTSSLCCTQNNGVSYQSMGLYINRDFGVLYAMPYV